jgi:hypothetical protein
MDYQNGDKIATYRTEDITGYPNEWDVAWVAPARHHAYRNEAGNRPDIVVRCNEIAIVAIEVKNWKTTGGTISQHHVLSEMVKRFVGVLNCKVNVVLSTADNFNDRQQALDWLKACYINFRLIHHRPLPDSDLEATISEMRQVLEEFITLELLKDKAYG